MLRARTVSRMDKGFDMGITFRTLILDVLCMLREPQLAASLRQTPGRIQQVEPRNSGLHNSNGVDYRALKFALPFGAYIYTWNAK